jgi:predicted RNase H-like nuclease (RuvC/YqgF family)
MEYTPRQLAQLAGLKGPRHITDLCMQGQFPGARKNAKGQWLIPKEEALAWLAAREVEVEVLPPEGINLIPRETAEAFVIDIVKKALSEVEKRSSEVVSTLEKEVAELKEVNQKKSEEVGELKEEVAELRKKLAEEMSRKSEEVSELRRLSEERSQEVMLAIREIQKQQEELQKNKRPWWRFWR